MAGHDGVLRVLGALRRFGADRSANFATLTALTLPVVLAAAAFAVDEASLYLERRSLQAAVDLAAIAAAGDPANARQRAYEALQDAGLIAQGVPVEAVTDIETGTLEITAGHYSADAALPPEQRFVAGALPANAVRVAYSHPGRLYFARHWFAEPTLSARASAFASPQAAFSLGSRLASLEGGIANAVLESLLGTSLSLTALDHRALLDLDADLLTTLDGLATQLDLTAATYDDVLQAETTLPVLAQALAAAAPPGDRGAAILADLAGTLDSAKTVRLGDVIALGPLASERVGGGGAALAVSALQTLSLAALLAEGGNQLALGLDAGVPGVLGVSVALGVGEPVQHTGYLALGADTATLETAQLRLALTVDLRVNAGAGFGLLDVKLPLALELAPARARLASLSCPPSGRVTLAVEPGILRLAIGRPAALTPDADPLVSGAAPIVDVLGLVTVTAQADAASHQIAPVSVGFTEADIAAGTVRTVTTTTPLESLLVTLLRRTDLDVELAGFSLLGPVLALGLEDALKTALVSVAPALDTVIVGMLSSLGVSIGEADVRVNGLICRNAVLVE